MFHAEGGLQKQARGARKISKANLHYFNDLRSKTHDYRIADSRTGLCTLVDAVERSELAAAAIFSIAFVYAAAQAPSTAIECGVRSTSPN